MSKIKEFLNTPDEVERVEGEVDDYLSELQELFFEFIESHVDMDYLTEEQLEILDKILELTESEDEEDDEEVSEALGKRKRVVRGGKKQRKLQCPKGYKAQGGRCVRQTAKEKRTRQKAQKKGARKRRTKQAQATRKRQRSMRRRT